MSELKGYDNIKVEEVIKLVEVWCSLHKIHEDHGLWHFINVTNHAIKALNRENLSIFNGTSIVLAALLHDVDDRKIKVECPNEVYKVYHIRMLDIF